MNLYELNQSGYNSLPKMAKAEIEAAKFKIRDSFDIDLSRYFMLVCNELHYYTLFHMNTQLHGAELINELFNIVKDLGQLKAVEVTDSMVEFWISRDGECHMYAFFDYDRGVVEI